MKQFKRDENQNSKKLHLDKYYTSDETAQYCIDVARRVLNGKKISEAIEPSAGNGVFSKKIKNCIAYDIDPEDKSIIRQDFLTLDLPYKEGRLFIGNPPFGARNTLAVQFFKKCILSGDYIAFILPISQYKNNQQMYEFDLIYSENLGVKQYTDRDVHCCFNIYEKPNGNLNTKPQNKLNDLEIIEVRLGNKIVENYDFKVCAWGASIGKFIDDKNSFAKEFYIRIKNNNIKNKIVELFKNVNWQKEYLMTSTPNLLQWQVVEYLKKNGIK